MRQRGWVALALMIPVVCLGADSNSGISPQLRDALARIGPDSLKGNLSFLSSDLLEGRGTPSRGLDLAAEFIAAQFRRAGLEPGGDDGYFQTAKFVSVEQNRDGLKFDVTGIPAVPIDQVNADTPVAATITDQPAVKFADGQDVTGKVVVVYGADFRQVMSERQKVTAAGRPALLILTGPGAGRFRQRVALMPAEERAKAFATISIRDNDFAAKIKDAPAGELPFRVSVTIPNPIEKAIPLKNVVGILRGSDASLKDTCELVTAHYDHLGMKAEGDGDRIYNGANDDGSGTVSLIEIASALAAMPVKPKRSILFVAVFGEEVGLLGSRYYAAHPVFPLAKTVADVNLEHMGRTDSNLGPHVNMVNFTGFDFSDVPAIFKKAGDLTGVSVVKDEKNSDPYFARSDNQALADAGVPAHTISVSYEFPEYHQVGDEWQKVDYDNMAKIDRMVALGLMMIADSTSAPKWNEAEPKAQKYVDAARALRP